MGKGVMLVRLPNAGLLLQTGELDDRVCVGTPAGLSAATLDQAASSR
jgi:hypothetical protein